MTPASPAFNAADPTSVDALAVALVTAMGKATPGGEASYSRSSDKARIDELMQELSRCRQEHIQATATWREAEEATTRRIQEQDQRVRELELEARHGSAGQHGLDVGHDRPFEHRYGLLP